MDYLTSPEARELSLYIDNTEGYYRDTLRVNARLTKFYVRGDFDLDRAIKAFTYVVNAAAKQYNREHGSMTSKWSDLFPKGDRDKVSEHYARAFVDLVRNPTVWDDLGDDAARALRKNTAGGAS